MSDIKINISFNDGILEGNISINGISEEIKGSGGLGFSEMNCGFLDNNIYHLNEYEERLIDDLIATFQNVIHSYYREQDIKIINNF